MTKQERLNLERFGCALRRGVLYIEMPVVSQEKALGAGIVFRNIYEEYPSGPLLCLGLEISPTPVLPHYCYFPFNPKEQIHVQYLSSLTTMGRLELRLVTQAGTVPRDYRLRTSQQKRMEEYWTRILRVSREQKGYSFADAVLSFEKSFRIPQAFERAVSENELFELLDKLKAQAETISPEKRALARQITRGVAQVLKERMGRDIREHMERVKTTRRGTLLLFDFEREFRDDYERCADCVADALALSQDEEVLRRWLDWPSKVESAFKLFQQLSTDSEAEQQKIREDMFAAVNQTLSIIRSGRELSFAALQNLLVPFRPLLSSAPGRPTKDYSREYGWKAAGRSWTEVARQSLQENSELREEFSGRDFESLSFEQQENLKNRIREGVRSYAERIGKPFPIKASGRETPYTKHPPQ